MTETNDGGPAFPLTDDEVRGILRQNAWMEGEIYRLKRELENERMAAAHSYEEMVAHGKRADEAKEFYRQTARDRFARAALAGMLACGVDYVEDAARDAYEAADAMLAERERGRG